MANRRGSGLTVGAKGRVVLTAMEYRCVNVVWPNRFSMVYLRPWSLDLEALINHKTPPPPREGTESHPPPPPPPPPSTPDRASSQQRYFICLQQNGRLVTLLVNKRMCMSAHKRTEKRDQTVDSDTFLLEVSEQVLPPEVYWEQLELSPAAQ